MKIKANVGDQVAMAFGFQLNQGGWLPCVMTGPDGDMHVYVFRKDSDEYIRDMAKVLTSIQTDETGGPDYVMYHTADERPDVVQAILMVADTWVGSSEYVPLVRRMVDADLVEWARDGNTYFAFLFR